MSPVSRCVKQFQSKCNFSIDHILNVAGERNKAEDEADGEKKFEWLNCTRYKPPKLQRQRKRDGIQRRKPGRNPRIPFSSSQVAFLEARFVRTPYLSSSDVSQLAANLQLSETRVKIWFQNRRARERRDRETKNKAADALKGQASHPTEENVFVQCFHPERIQKDHFYPYRSVDFTDRNNYVQIISPLNLSERQLLFKSGDIS